MKIPDALKTAHQHHAAGGFRDAEIICHKILAVDSGHGGALYLLALMALQAGQTERAIEWLQRAVGGGQGSARIHELLGRAYHRLNRMTEAIASYGTAVQLDPGFAIAHNNLGSALAAQAQPEAALLHLSEALRCDPRLPEAQCGIATPLVQLGRIPEARAHLEEAIRLRPGFPEAHYNLSHLQLLLGEFTEGWLEHEWRWTTSPPKSPVRNFRQLMWSGEDITDRILLIHAEQGIGDTLQFCRYAPIVAERCAKVFLEVQPELVELLRVSFARHNVEVLPRPAGFPDVRGLPDFDYHCPAMSLPRSFHTASDTIPAEVPYLHPETGRIALWSRRIGTLPRPRVGLVWAGRAQHGRDKLRSIDPELLRPLVEIPGISVVSLQKGERGKGHRLPIHDMTDDLCDFADTAALTSLLDLVITVDTSVAHLAGGLGRPVWLLNRYDTDWRWLLERLDSPWYPTMRIFRQPRFGEWDTVIDSAAEMLAALSANRFC